MPACADTFVNVAVAVVPIELVVAAGRRAAHARRVARYVAAREILRRIVEQKEVEASVAVVIQKRGMRGEAGVGDAVLRGGLGEGAVAGC